MTTTGAEASLHAVPRVHRVPRGAMLMAFWTILVLL